ncbi:dipeptidase [Streptomyces sp. st77]|uniref:dipeptidase n=1 Tax=Streptomyces sp. st77 TaxID=1828074 RepID=UPI00211D94EF|nr:dipeptidase [Streptomyces sp. st77]
MVDATHCSYRTSMDIFAATSPRPSVDTGGRRPTAPVVLSHSATRAVHDHESNVWDDQIRAQRWTRPVGESSRPVRGR